MKIVFELTNSQRMALCTLIHEYIMKVNLGDRHILPENFVDCSEAKEVITTPAELLNIFMQVSRLTTSTEDAQELHQLAMDAAKEGLI